MARPLTWERVARILGTRMEAHAFCVDHPEKASRGDCPFCQDRAAYRLYTDKLGYVPKDPLIGTSTVLLSDLKRHFEDEGAQ